MATTPLSAEKIVPSEATYMDKAISFVLLQILLTGLGFCFDAAAPRARQLLRINCQSASAQSLPTYLQPRTGSTPQPTSLQPPSSSSPAPVPGPTLPAAPAASGPGDWGFKGSLIWCFLNALTIEGIGHSLCRQPVLGKLRWVSLHGNQ